MSSIQTSKNLVAFMAHIPFSKPHLQYVQKQLLKDIVPDSKYLVVGETSSQGIKHIHILCHMIPAAYARFAKRVFIDKYHLTGRATTGKPRQYGKLKKVESERRMTIYMMKDFFYNNKSTMITNMNLNYLNKLAKLSFRKKELRTPYKKYILELASHLKTYNNDYITKSTLVLAWIKICDTRPPMMKSLWWYALKATVIDEKDYIEFCYPTNSFELAGVPNKYVEDVQNPKYVPLHCKNGYVLNTKAENPYSTP